MSSVPFSLRLPKALVELVQALAEKTGLSAPDTVRAAIVSAHGQEYRLQVIDRLQEPREVLKRTRAHIKDGLVSMAAPDYSALMYFWHWAYMNGEGYANPSYVRLLLDITSALISELQHIGAPADLHHTRSKLGLSDDESFQIGIERIQHEFACNPSVGWAEVLTRPLEALADSLQYLDKGAISRVFGVRVEQVLPVAVLGAKAGLDGDLIDWDMKALLPQPERFMLNNLSVTLYASPMSIMIEEGHHCYAFQQESVLAVAAGVAGDVFARMMAIQDDHVWPYGRFQLAQFDATRFKGTVILHERGGYRLHLSDAEFKVWIEKLAAQFSQPAWAWVLKRHRDLRGDR